MLSSIPTSLYGNSYFLSIMDDYSHFSRVLFIKIKIDTFTLYYFWSTKIKNQFITRIKYIRLDNGTEFKNKYFSKFVYNIAFNINLQYSTILNKMTV